MTTHENTPTDPGGAPDAQPTAAPETGAATDDTTRLPRQQPQPRVTATPSAYGQEETPAGSTRPPHEQRTSDTRPLPEQERPTAAAPPVWSAATVTAARPRGPRSGTLVLGLVLTVSGVAAVLVALGFRIDLQLALIGLLVLAALTLLLSPLLRKRPASPAEGAGRAS
ncbi:hypothetical protein [Georgenia yuyongxinii]